MQFILIGAIVLAMIAPPVWAQSPADSMTKAQAVEVRTVWTSEFGLQSPSGLTFITDRNQFLVVGIGVSGNALLLGTDEDLQGAIELAGLVNPSTIAYDPARGVISSFDGATKTEWAGNGLDARRSHGRRTTTSPLTGVTVVSSAYDTATGDLLVLTTRNEILRVSDNNTSTISLRSPSDPKLIASNPVDGRIYVMGTDHTVTSIDAGGAVQSVFDFSSIQLVEPTSMVFAPTSDATDNVLNQNLFIADSGGTSTLGGVTEVSLQTTATAVSIPIDVGSLVRMTATSAWSPASPDPAGVAYLPDHDSLLVVDSEVDEVTGAGWNNVNMWRTQRSGVVQATGTFWGPTAAVYNGKVGYSKEPTGASYDPRPTSQTLFVSDDSAKKVFVVKKGSDGKFGTSDDAVTAIPASSYGSTDTEDPEYDTTTGHLFFLDGVGMEIYRIDPVDGVFGNANDQMTHFDISHLGPKDFEGLASNPARGTLYVGARSTKRIYEITKTGTLLREISVSGISGLRYISGLAVAPSSDNSSLTSFYIVDRQVDNGADANENDGRMWEVRAPDSLAGPGDPINQAPAVDAGPNMTVTLPAVASLNGTVTDDGLPSGATLTSQWSVVAAPTGGVVTFGDASSTATTATFSLAGTYVLRLTASDTQLTSSDEVSIQVNAAPSGATEFRATSQSSVIGAVNGGIEGTFVANDGLTQDIKEVTDSKGLRAKLEHTWTFNVTTTSQLRFVLKVSRVGTEDYKFAYSNNGGSSWKSMVTVQTATDYEYVMPTGVTGTVIVRVRDVDRARGDTVSDTLKVDRLVLVSG